MNGRTRRVLYRIIAQRDGDFCKMCTIPASDRQLVIDHIDNDNANNLLSNLQLLCRACNYRKNSRQPVATSVSSASIALGINRSKEPEFRRYIYGELVYGRSRRFREFVYAGAEKVGISPVTAKRYLDKMLSQTGALRFHFGHVQFKEQHIFEEILPDEELDIIFAIVRRRDQEIANTTATSN